ncbi:MAG: P1 family peptidase [candidate division KSB1 bacterium]|nr:P1 family peptidase [candidate division KSB1 bacterium]
MAASPAFCQPRKGFPPELRVGILPRGPLNSITDVGGVKVGHVTLRTPDGVCTGVTAILPHGGNLFQEKVPAAIVVGNGFGKLVGSTQVEELGTLETPIILTNTLAVGIAAEAVVQWTIRQPGNEGVQSVNPVVGETNDGYLNDIRRLSVRPEHVWQAIDSARAGAVAEGCVGAGTGTVCFGFKGGIGTASRKLPISLGGYTVGVLVQTNFGGVLQIAGVPVGQELGVYYLRDALPTDGGSCMIVVATDAPLDARQLKRLAFRALYGLARTGGLSSHGSGDYVIAFSTAPENRVPHQAAEPVRVVPILRDEHLSPLFLAAIEATEEAIYHSLFAAETTHGRDGHVVEAIPVDKVIDILRRYRRLP